MGTGLVCVELSAAHARRGLDDIGRGALELRRALLHATHQRPAVPALPTASIIASFARVGGPGCARRLELEAADGATALVDGLGALVLHGRELRARDEQVQRSQHDDASAGAPTKWSV